MTTDSRPPDLPEIIGGRYRVVGELGRGGMARVLKVVHEHTGEALAMKVLFVRPHGRDRLVERFRREARSLAQVRGEHVVRVIDADIAPELDGTPYIVTELLEGEDLSEHVSRFGLIAPDRVVELLDQTAQGLARVHDAGLVHRDLKPGNIYLHDAGDGVTVKLLDFGLVRIVDASPNDEDVLTKSGEILGTPIFMSPEQVHGDPEAIGRPTDIWALGMIAFYLLAGRPYWDLREMPGGIFDIGRAPMRPPSKMEPSLTMAFDSWFFRSCSLNPQARWPDAPAQIRELARALGVPFARPERPVAGALSLASDAVTRMPGDLRPMAQTGASATGASSSGRHRRQVTVLFYRLTHTAAGGQDIEPEDYETAERHLHADLDKALGDLHDTGSQLARGGRFVFYGYPRGYGSDARRAVEAAFRLTAAVAELDARARATGGGLQVRVGIHSGVVMAGSSAERPGDLDVVGPALGAAVELAYRAKPGQVLVHESTRRLVGDQFGGHPLPEGAFLVTPRTASDDETSAGPAMVGREAELSMLTACLVEARRGDAQTVLVTGDVGLGKSRLVRALREQPEAEEVEWLECQCSPYFQRTPFHPVLDLIRQLVARVSGNAFSVDSMTAGLDGLAAALDLDEATSLSLGSLLSAGAEQASQELERVSPQMRRQRAIEALILLLHRAANHRPLVVVVEDLHWADPSTVELLDRLSVTHGAPMLAVLTARLDFTPAWTSPSSITPVLIRRLPLAQTARLVEAVSDGALSDSVASLIAETTDGVPLFIEELTRLMADRAEGRLGEVLPGGMVPTTLREALDARLDTLGESRRLAELASVLGSTFEVSDLELFEDGPGNVASHIIELVRAKIIQPQGPPPHRTYAFQHALIRDTAHGSLPRNVRRALHLRVATAFSERGDVVPEVVAHHYAEGGMESAAAGLLLNAGQAALERSANVEARAHFQRGVDLLERPAPDRSPAQADDDEALDITLRTMVGMSWVVSKGYAVPEAEAAFASASERIRRLARDDMPQLVPALWAQWIFALLPGKTADADREAERLWRVAARVGDPGVEMMAYLAIGTTRLDQGRLGEADSALSEALSRYDADAHAAYRFLYGQDPLMFGLAFRAWVRWGLGRADAALDDVRAAVEHARPLRHPNSLGFALAIEAIIHQYRGDAEALARSASALRTLSMEQGWLQWLAHAELWTGAAMVLEGSAEAALDGMRKARAMATAVGEVSGATHYDTVFADALIRAGELDEAASRLAAGRAVIDGGACSAFEPELLRMEGRLARLRGDLPAALELLETAYSRSAGCPGYRLRIVTDLVETSRSAGRDTGPALGRLSDVLSFLSEGESTADVRAARAMVGARQEMAGDSKGGEES